jgi:hypothetical protein
MGGNRETQIFRKTQTDFRGSWSPAHRDKTTMNGAQFFMDHSDSSKMKSVPPAFEDGSRGLPHLPHKTRQIWGTRRGGLDTRPSMTTMTGYLYDDEGRRVAKGATKPNTRLQKLHAATILNKSLCPLSRANSM